MCGACEFTATHQQILRTMRENNKAHQHLDNVKQKPQTLSNLKEQDFGNKNFQSKNRKSPGATATDGRRLRRSENSRAEVAEKHSQQATRTNKHVTQRSSSGGASKSSRKTNSKLKQVAIEDIITREKKRQAILAKAQEQAQAKFARNHNLEGEGAKPPAKMVVAYSKRLLRKLKPAPNDDPNRTCTNIDSSNVVTSADQSVMHKGSTVTEQAKRDSAHQSHSNCSISCDASSTCSSLDVAMESIYGNAFGFDFYLEGVSDVDDEPTMYRTAESKLADKDETQLSSVFNKFGFHAWGDSLEKSGTTGLPFDPIVLRTSSASSSSSEGSCASPKQASPTRRSLLSERLRDQRPSCRSYSLYDGFVRNSADNLWAAPTASIPTSQSTEEQGQCTGFYKTNSTSGLPWLPDDPFCSQFKFRSENRGQDINQHPSFSTKTSGQDTSSQSFDQLQYDMIKALELGFSETLRAH